MSPALFLPHPEIMKIAATIARYLLGIIFVVFGLNGLAPFIPQPPFQGLAGQFLTAAVASHFMTAVFAAQLVCGILLLANRYVPLAVTLLGAVMFNIIDFHVTMNPEGLPIALVTAVLWMVVAFSVRSALAGIFQQKSL